MLPDRHNVDMRTDSAYRSRRFGKPLEYQWLSDLSIRIMPIGIMGYDRIDRHKICYASGSCTSSVACPLNPFFGKITSKHEIEKDSVWNTSAKHSTIPLPFFVKGSGKPSMMSLSTKKHSYL